MPHIQVPNFQVRHVQAPHIQVSTVQLPNVKAQQIHVQSINISPTQLLNIQERMQTDVLRHEGGRNYRFGTESRDLTMWTTPMSPKPHM